MSCELIASVDMRRLFGPARDQGTRPTCLAFAVSDAHAAMRNPWNELSVEYLYYHAQSLAGRTADAGCTTTSAMAALRSVGQPLESDWAYLAAVPELESDWLPPSVSRRYGRAAEFLDASLQVVMSSLATDRPVVLIIKLTTAFYSPDVGGGVQHDDGVAVTSVAIHAVLAVGHGVLHDQPTILVRNSWGRGWGLDGHAWLTCGYLRSCLCGVLLLKEEVDVSGYSPAA